MFADVLESGGLSSTEYWEHIAEPGCDRGWLDDLDAQPLAPEVLARMADSVLQKTGLSTDIALGANKGSGKRVLDVGSGSGLVAQSLAAAASRYTAVDTAAPGGWNIAANEKGTLPWPLTQTGSYKTASKLTSGGSQFFRRCEHHRAVGVMSAGMYTDILPVNDMRQRTPSPRLGKPDDIAGAVAFLASDDGIFINGQVWHVNGGTQMRD